MPLLRKNGSIEWLTAHSAPEFLSIQGIADQLHANARMFRVFAATDKTVDMAQVLALIEAHQPAQGSSQT